jgi:hypothetical protein
VIGFGFRYGVMESGNIRARAIARAPNSARAVNPKFRRVRRFGSIGVSRRLSRPQKKMQRSNRNDVEYSSEHLMPTRASRRRRSGPRHAR